MMLMQGVASLAQGKWTLAREPVAKGKDPKLAALRLVDDDENSFNGAPQSVSNQGSF